LGFITPFIRDSEARNITFASAFVETGKGEGILYAHIDDSFCAGLYSQSRVIKINIAS